LPKRKKPHFPDQEGKKHYSEGKRCKVAAAAGSRGAVPDEGRTNRRENVAVNILKGNQKNSETRTLLRPVPEGS